jgi:type II secretory pathway component GspD/PulD (secretin)
MFVKKRMSVLAVALVLPLFGGSAFAQVPSVDARVTLSIADKSLEEIVKSLRDRSGSNIVIIDPVEKAKISTTKVSIEVFDVGWRDALELVAEKAGCVVEERPGGVLAITKPPEVTIEFQDQDVRKVIETIAAVSGASITLGKEVSGNITVRFKDVPWRVALDVTAKTLGFVVVEEKRGVLRIVSPDTLKDQLDTHTYQLRYLRPPTKYLPLIKSEFLQPMQAQQQQSAQGKGGAIDYTKTFTVLAALEKTLSAQGKLDYVDISNVVIVRDTAQVHASIKDMLSRLDVEPAQIFVDVKFVSTTNTDLLNLGVDYGDGGPQISLSGGAIPVTFPFDLGKGGFEDGMIVNSTGTGPFADPTLNAGSTQIPDTIFGSLSFTEVTATLRLLQRDTKSEVIQAPKLITLDGNAGTIFVGETIRYAEAKSEQGQAGGLQLSVAEASGSPVEVGFQLLVRPNVIPGTEKMVMEVIPKETSLSGTGSSAFAPAGFDVFTVGAGGSAGSIALPRTRSSTIVTSMMIESGRTVMIGGLSSEADTQTKTKVPLLGDIPLIGELFKHRNNSRERRSLLVFLTPTIVRSSEDSQRLLQQELKRRRGELKKELEELKDAQLEPVKEPAAGTGN